MTAGLVMGSTYRCPCCEMPLTGTPEGHLPNCVVRECTERNLAADGWIRAEKAEPEGLEQIAREIAEAMHKHAAVWDLDEYDDRQELIRFLQAHTLPAGPLPDAETLAKQKDAAYAERDNLVCALSKLFPSTLERHPDSDKTWDNDWRWIVFVNLPTGQATWHIHDSELAMFDHLPRNTGAIWDGHTTPQKYLRLAALHHAAPRSCGHEMKLRAADAMAKVIDVMVEGKQIDERSPLADARLDYGEPYKYEHAAPSGWVRVDTRMPEVPANGIGGWYLVSDGSRCDVAKLLKGDTFMGHALQFEDITHWRPIPAPPTEDAAPETSTRTMSTAEALEQGPWSKPKESQ